MEEYRRWEDNIKMDLKVIDVSVRSCVDSAEDRDYWRFLVNEPPKTAVLATGSSYLL